MQAKLHIEFNIRPFPPHGKPRVIAYVEETELEDGVDHELNGVCPHTNRPVTYSQAIITTQDAQMDFEKAMKKMFDYTQKIEYNLKS